MRARTLRTDLTLSYAGVLALFLAALGFTYYHVFVRQLDVDATAELAEVTRGVHGYMKFHDGMPMLLYDRDDPDQVVFVQDATRYYQVYDGSTGRLLLESAVARASGTPTRGRGPRIPRTRCPSRRPDNECREQSGTRQHIHREIADPFFIW